MLEEKTVKCVVIGDRGVGKTSLLYSYTDNILPTDDYVPAIFESRTERVLVDGKEISLSLWDNSDIVHSEQLKPIVYPTTDVFVICFSLSSQDSFKNVHTRWFSEVSQYEPEVPIVLAGTKLDLCRSQSVDGGGCGDFKPVTTEQGVDMCRCIGAVKYIECSAVTGVGLKKVFDEVCRVHIQRTTSRGRLKMEDDLTCVGCEVM